MRFGLTDKQLRILCDIFSQHLRSGEVLVYGSRAKGNYTPTSDIDLVIKNAGMMDRDILADIHDQIDESDFPYLCDLQYFEQVKNPLLLDHIQRLGQVLYGTESEKQELL